MPKISQLTKNLFLIRIPPRYVVASLIAFLGLIISVTAAYWLNLATSEEVDVQSGLPVDSNSPERIPLTRQDVDVVLAIDYSGSMDGDNGSDPSGLRKQAAEVLISSLAADIFPRSTRLGYVEFATTAKPAVGLTTLEAYVDRKGLIEAVYQPPSLDVEYTNIPNALLTAQDMLFPEGEPVSKNVPSIVLLTDGYPTGAGSISEQAMEKIIESLSNRGVVTFIILLRNPAVPETDEFKVWRNNWNQISLKYSRSVEYYEVQSSDQLIDIYNQVRLRLVNEGTKPAGSRIYDPSNANEAIEIPPDLLQAHLIVGKPGGVGSIDLINPDGQSFKDYAEVGSKNEIFEGELYYRFKIFQPAAGAWRLNTNTKQPINYLLNLESKFSPRIAMRGAPYVNLDRETLLPIIIVDPDGNIISSPLFNLKVNLLSKEQLDNNSSGNQEVHLPPPEIITKPWGVSYYVKILPEMIDTSNMITLQIDGTSDSGALVNNSIFIIRAALLPTDLMLFAPDTVTCSNERLQISPPRIICNNFVDVQMGIDMLERLDSGSAIGSVYIFDSKYVDIPISSTAPVSTRIGPFQDVGNYNLSVEFSGKLNDNASNWQASKEDAIRVEWPEWTNYWKRFLHYAIPLLLICALWKPAIVPLLLIAFSFLKMAPSGRYAIMEQNIYSQNVYDKAMSRRKLFVLTVGDTHNADIKMPVDLTDAPPSVSKSRFLRRINRIILNWFKKQPNGRLVMIPWSGIHYEIEGDFGKASENQPSVVRFGRGSLLISQKDWTNK